MAHTYAAMNLLKTITQQRQLITIFVTHDLNFALHNANSVLLMHNGQLNHAGPPASVLSPSRIAEIFGVMARVEYCSRGNPFIFIDGPAKNSL
jgi:iron complex transport system ATP-binding protein